MRVGLLQCDNVLEKFQGAFGNYPAMVQRMFNGVDEKLEFTCFDCQQGEFPEDVDAFDFYITTGSKASAYDDVSWVRQIIDFTAELDRQQKKLVGICFGHQVIALALGGAVEKSPKGWGIGVAQNAVIAKPDWMRQASTRLNMLVSHQDQVSRLAGHAQVIAESDFCPYFVVQWGDNFLSIQGHPEWLADYSRALMNDRRAIIPAARIEAGMRSLQYSPDSDLFVEWVMDFVRH